MELGRYRVIRKLGEGGMAQVLLAASPGGALVVLKVPFSSNPDFAERLRDEARVGLRLNHPTIVETLDLFEHEGRPILVVEYVDGPSLAQLRRHLGPLPPSLVARLARQVAEGLEAIHAASDEYGTPLNILHRDVAPGNILMSPAGDAKLIDLGIARGIETKSRRTQIGAVRGTMRYLAPELLDGMRHSPATDLWALGVTLFEAALGRRAVEGDERVILAAIVRGTITKLHEGEQINPRLDSGLRALLAPAETRLQRSLAAANIFRRIEEQLGPPPEAVLKRVRALARDLEEESRKTPAPITIEPALPSIADAPAPLTSETAIAGDDLQPLDDNEELSATRPAVDPSAITARPTAQMPAVALPRDAYREDQVRPNAERLENTDPDAPTIQMARVSDEDLPALADEDDEAVPTIAEKGPPAAMPAPTVLEQPLVDLPSAPADTVQDLRLPAALRQAAQQAAPPAAAPRAVTIGELPAQGDLPVTDPARPSAKSEAEVEADPDPTLPVPEPGSAEGFPGTAPFVTEPVPAPSDDGALDAALDQAPSAQTMRFAVPVIPTGPTARPEAKELSSPTSTQMLPTPGMPETESGPTGFPAVGPSTMLIPQPGRADAPGQPLEAAEPAPAAAAPKAPAPKSTQMLPTPGAALAGAKLVRDEHELPEKASTAPLPQPAPPAPEPEPQADVPVVTPPPPAAQAAPATSVAAPDELTERVNRKKPEPPPAADAPGFEPLNTSELAFKHSSAAPMIIAGVVITLLCIGGFLAFFFGAFDSFMGPVGPTPEALEVIEDKPAED
jgi:serine/threonine protein kinase